jgi:hypothetical protein
MCPFSWLFFESDSDATPAPLLLASRKARACDKAYQGRLVAAARRHGTVCCCDRGAILNANFFPRPSHHPHITPVLQDSTVKAGHVRSIQRTRYGFFDNISQGVFS